jgi:phage tail protein X
MNRVHVSKANESIQRIASRFYGRWELWRLILDANESITDWKQIESGLVIEIPDPKTDDSFHRIQTKDTYESLSHFYYGTEHFSNLIRAENNNIPLYENLGVEILIPRLISKAELELAKKRMER